MKGFLATFVFCIILAILGNIGFDPIAEIWNSQPKELTDVDAWKKLINGMNFNKYNMDIKGASVLIVPGTSMLIISFLLLWYRRIDW